MIDDQKKLENKKNIDEIASDFSVGAKYVIGLVSQCADELVEAGADFLKRLKKAKLPPKDSVKSEKGPDL